MQIFLGRIVRQGEANQVPVLLYHHILPKDDLEGYRWNNNDSVVSLESFQAQMKYLKDNNYYTATLKDLERFIKGEQKLPKKTVVITFDDGYLSNLVHAYPVMKEYGFKGTIFVIGDSEKKEKRKNMILPLLKGFIFQKQKNIQMYLNMAAIPMIFTL